MNKDKLRSIISKKANGNSTLSGQLYQMFFFEKILGMKMNMVDLKLT